MRPVARNTACTLALVAALAAAGCGDDETGARTATTGAATAPGDALPTARFTFAEDGTLRPALLRIDAAPQIRLTLVAADGRPHGVVVRTPAGRVRVVVMPGAVQSAILSGLRGGRRYRVVPDGATAPVTLQVR